MPKILVADDDHDIRELIVLTLQFNGFDVVGVSDGAKVLTAAECDNFDLFLLDVRMPHMTGYEACRHLKENEATKEIPVVFLSAKGQESEVQTGLDAGAVEYVLKPFAPDIVIEVVNRAIQKAERLKLLRNFDAGHIVSVAPEIIVKNVRWLFIQYDWALNKIKSLNTKIAYLEKENKQMLWQLKSAADQKKRLESEREQLEQKLSPSAIRRLYLEEMSQMTDGIVHDMRNGLGVIHNTLGFLKDELSEESHQADVAKISSSLNFCELVLRNLSALGGRDVFQLQPVNLEENVREVYSMLQRKLVDVELIVDADPHVPTIMADEGHIKQVFMNLIKNAGEAMPEGGTISFKTKGYRTNKTRVKKIRIEISDTGTGISKENQKRLFDGELFTTKETGYGLGLYIVQTIVKRHKGHVRVKSIMGEGTTFIIYLPTGN